MPGRKNSVRLPDSSTLDGRRDDAESYWRFAGDVSADAPLDPPTGADETSVLKKLGPLPFPRAGFPIMGFLATLYEHVARHAREILEKSR